MSPQGLLTIRYSDKIYNTSLINSTVLNLHVKNASLLTPDSNKTILSWNITAIRDREWDFSIEFAVPGDISSDKVRYTITLSLITPDDLSISLFNSCDHDDIMNR